MRETSQSVDPQTALAERLASTRLALTANAERLVQARERLRETLQSRQSREPEHEIMREVAHAHLVARLNSMPVIEQAKGILMAQSRCSAAEAFSMLRAASQRSNVKVRDLAEEIVRRVTESPPPGP